MIALTKVQLITSIKDYLAVANQEEVEDLAKLVLNRWVVSNVVDIVRATEHAVQKVAKDHCLTIEQVIRK